MSYPDEKFKQVIDSLINPLVDSFKSAFESCEKIISRVKSVSRESTDEEYPTAKAVYTFGEEIKKETSETYEKLTSKKTVVNSDSNDEEYPTAKAVYDFVESNTEQQFDAKSEKPQSGIAIAQATERAIAKAVAQTEEQVVGKVSAFANYVNENVLITEDVTPNVKNVSSSIVGAMTYMSKTIMFAESNQIFKIILNQWNIEEVVIDDFLRVEFRIPSQTDGVNDSTLFKSYEVPITARGVADYELDINISSDELADLPEEFILGIVSKSLNRVAIGYGSTSNMLYDFNRITIADSTKCMYLGYYLQSAYEPDGFFAQYIGLSYATVSYASPIITFVTNDYQIDAEKLGKYLGTNAFEKLKNKVSRISEESTDEEYPTALAVYQLVNFKNGILKLPEKFDLVVGDTFELFYKGIVNVLNSDEYDFEITFSDNSNLGRGYKRKFVFTPANVGIKTMTVVVRDNEGNIVESQNVVLNIIEKPTSPASNKVVLCVGDSLSSGGYWQAELNRRLTASEGTPVGLGLNNIQFIGTQEYNGTQFEGYGGWKFSSYLGEHKTDAYMNIYGSFDKTEADQHSVYQDANGVQWKLETIGTEKIKIIRVSSSGTLPGTGTLTWVSGGGNSNKIVYTSSEQASGNPFWNEETERNDFAAYAQRMGVSSIDYVYILLGWNSSFESKETYMTNCKSFIDGILADFPECKIGLIGLQVPSRNGFAYNYGVSWKFFDRLQFVWSLQDWYTELSHEETYAGKVEYINFAGQFDTENSVSSTDIAVNVRSVKTENVQINGVHPNNEGYMQLADVVYRNICARLQE